ncbi:MAG: hypothetical protein ACJ8BF_11205 [Gemmatimonadales bacterium]
MAVVALWACRTDEPRNGRTASHTPLGHADSLVAANTEGVEVWFTLVRAGRAADGTRCVERGLEIRRDATRIAVPLLYTGVPPVFLDSSTMRAELWNHCRVVDTYLVDLRSGRPVRERPRGAS